MNKKEWQKVNQIVDTALELDKQERTTHIEEQCAGDEHLRYLVFELLESIEEAKTEHFLEGTNDYPKHLAADFSKEESKEFTSSLTGSTIGHYKITELIGHGGMGSVFKAKRADDAYKGTVAFKAMRRGMDTPSNIARFKRERNILAKLDHPNIARLLDGGVTEDGLPYLVMGYVDGTPLYEYCDNHQLPVEERLELFKSIGEAVQHAHRNAVIHRDLKPSNILVTEEGQVKILDFGIAKLLEPAYPETTLYQTRTGARMLTLSYASPEQVEAEPVTTASDIYALGILLYELLAGVPPLELESKNVKEIEKLIRKQMPVRPSSKFSDQFPDKQEQIADNRSTNPPALIKSLQGDLDAIVMKALRKEPKGRYSSAEQLLEDLQRHEKNQPVFARKGTVRYKTKKYIKRHKAGLAVVIGFLLLIIGFVGFYTWQITEERNKAQLEAEKAQQVSEFLTDLFQASDPTHNPEDTVTAATFLKRGQERINQLNDQPEVQGKLLGVIGQAHINIGNYDKAKNPLYRRLKMQENRHGKNHLDYASALNDVAYLNRKMGNFAKAESLIRQELKIQENNLGLKHERSAQSLSALAYNLSRQGKYETADSIYAKAMEVQRATFKPNNPDIATTLSDWALTVRQLGELEKAKEMDQEALSIWRKNYGNIHPVILEGLNNLASIEEMMGNFAAAESLYQQALTVNRRLYEGPNPNTAQLLNNISVFYLNTDQFSQAETYLKKALAMRKKVLRPDHPSMAESFIGLASFYSETEQYKKAKPLVKKALKIDRAAHGKNHHYVATDLRELGIIAKSQKLYDEAENYFSRSLEIFKQTLPSDHAYVALTLHSLGHLYYLKKEYKKAENMLRKTVNIRKQNFDEGDIRTARSQMLLGAVLRETENYKEAEKMLKSSYQALKKKMGPSNEETRNARKNLAELYTKWGKPELAAAYRDNHG